MFVNNFEDLTKDNLLSFTDIQDTLNVTKKKNKNKKTHGEEDTFHVETETGQGFVHF